MMLPAATLAALRSRLRSIGRGITALLAGVAPFLFAGRRGTQGPLVELLLGLVSLVLALGLAVLVYRWLTEFRPGSSAITVPRRVPVAVTAGVLVLLSAVSVGAFVYQQLTSEWFPAPLETSVTLLFWSVPAIGCARAGRVAWSRRRSVA